MIILALDTCTECCSVALFYQGKITERVEMTQRGHSDIILSMMDALFSQVDISISDVDILAFGRGPGSFTGVRVGVGVAQGIAFAREIPVVAISSLAAVAQSAADALDLDYLAVAMDARMGEVYCANYHRRDGVVYALDDERVCPPAQCLPESEQLWAGAGTAWGIYGELLTTQFNNQLAQVSVAQYPLAKSIIKLAQVEIAAGRTQTAEQAMPVYLRNNVAKKKGEQ